MLFATVSVAAHAQGNFPDSPANHWAYEALSKLKNEGLLVGYPDGLFRGARPASRYELAVAVFAAYKSLKDSSDHLEQLIANLPKNDSAEQIAELKAALADIQSKVNALSQYGDDLANLHKLTDTFEKELESLGVNVEEMRKDLSSLADRVINLEKKKPAVEILGDLNLWVGAGNSVDDHYGLNKDGRVTGTSNNNPLSNVFSPVDNPAGLTQDLTILHEAAFKLRSTNETGPKWSGTFVVGNMFSTPFDGFPDTNLAFGSQSSVLNPTGGSPLTGYSEGPQDFYIQDLQLEVPFKIGNVPVKGTFGRVPYKVNPLLFQRPDTTSYFSNPRWDDHKYRIDGGVLNFALGHTQVDLFGGSINKAKSAKGVDLFNLQIAGAIEKDNITDVGGDGGEETLAARKVTRGAGGSYFPIHQLGGASLHSKLGDLNLGVAYLWLDAAQDYIFSGQIGNQIQLFGGELGYEVGHWDIASHYGKAKLTQGNDNVNDDNNEAWDARVGYETGALELSGSYRAVEANYVAPGDWGRLGVERNPTNLGGWTGQARLALGPKWRLSGSYGQDKGLSNDFTQATLFDKDTTVDRYKVALSYVANAKTTYTLGFESSQFKKLVYPALTTDTSDPKYKWTTFTISHKAAKNTLVSVSYEVSDITNDFQVTTPGTGARFKGGFLTTQVMVKF